jgi:hypothetical protein
MASHICRTSGQFFPTDWVKKEFPEYAFLAEVERGVRELASEAEAEQQKAA